MQGNLHAQDCRLAQQAPAEEIRRAAIAAPAR